MINEDERLSKAKRSYDACPYVHDCQAYENFVINQKYNEQYSTDFINLDFRKEEFEEYMEYHAVVEFNKIKGKEFMPFDKFSKVYQEADQQAKMPASKTNDLCKKLLEGTDQKTSVIIISGIPGSGKGRVAEQLSRLLAQEDVPSVSFKMPTVQESIKYSTETFIKKLQLFK